jgi:hypothetical protein
MGQDEVIRRIDTMLDLRVGNTGYFYIFSDAVNTLRRIERLVLNFFPCSGH